MRTARSKRGLTTEVVVDSKGQSFEKNVKPEQMHEGDVALQFFSYLGKLQGEMTPEQKATVARELDQMVAAQRLELGLPQTESPYQPGMVIEWGGGKIGMVERFHGNSIQIRRVNDRGKTFTSVIDLIGTSEVEGRFGLDGLILEDAIRSPLILSKAKAELLKDKNSIREFFLSEVGSEVKEAVLDRLDCTPEAYLTILRQEGLNDSLVAQIAERAKDDRVYVFAAISCGCPELLDKVTDQSLLALVAMQDGGELRRHLGGLTLAALDDELSLRALDLIQDQDKLYEIANTAHGLTCEVAILEVKDDVKVRAWVVKSHGATTQLAPAWTKRFSTWSSEALNLMVMDTELIHNEGIFEAAAKTGKLDPTSYRAIVEKFERLNPLSERVLPYLMEAEDREFIASKLLKWASSQDQSSKKVVQSLEINCVAAAIRADMAKVPLSSDLVEMLAEIALLPVMVVGQVVENQSAYRAAKFGLVDPVVLQRVMKEAAMPEVRKLAEEKLAAIRRGDTDTT